MQKVQNLRAAFHDRDEGRGALRPRPAACASNFSISGKEISTCALPLALALGDQLRQAMQGLRAEDDVDVGRAGDDGRRPPGWRRSRRRRSPDPDSACFRCRTRPRSWKTFSCAFSRTEQVLNRMMSASSGLSVLTMPSEAASTSAILSESYSFIWHPKVRMNNFFGMDKLLCGIRGRNTRKSCDREQHCIIPDRKSR